MPYPPRRSSHRTAHRRGVLRRSSESAVDQTSSRVLSSEEKRELILAHHAARKKNGKPHPAWGFGYYVGIAASCLVIVTGWWATLSGSLNYEAQSSDEGVIQTIKNGINEFRSTWRSGAGRSANEVRNTVDAAKEEYQQAVIRQKALEAATKEIQKLNQLNTTTTKDRLKTSNE